MAVDYLREALTHLGLRTDESADPNADLLVHPGSTPVQVKKRSLVDERTAQHLLAEKPTSGAVLVVVAERVTASARKLLTAEGIGYLDLRGHLSLRTTHLILDTDVSRRDSAESKSKTLFAGKAGLEIVVALLMRPNEGSSVRALAREINRAPSTVSEELQALQSAELVDGRNRVTDEKLFWRLAEVWPDKPVYLRQAPDFAGGLASHSLGINPDDPTQPGWALAGDRAAVALGAPVATKVDARVEFYLPSAQNVHRARVLLGEARSGIDAACTVRLAPVGAVVWHRFWRRAEATLGWPVCHPLFVALDLAQDRGRGREILDAWTPDAEWDRVW